MKRGQVYYADFRDFFGSEQRGTIPCLILQNDIGNLHSPTVIVAPMTAKLKSKVPTHVKTTESDKNLFIGTIILLEQIRVLDKQRIGRFICKLSEETMNRVDAALKISLAPKEEKKGDENLTDVIKINNREILAKEYKGQRVVTFKDIDDVHERPDGTAKRNFNTNKKHFIEGEDFFLVSKNEVGTDFVQTYGFGESAPSGILITESGYLMLVKSITGDLAWEVQRELVKSYFNRKKRMSPEEMMRVQLGMIDDHENRIGNLDSRVENLENNTTIDYGQQRVLEREVNKTVIDVLGGKESNAYKEISKKVFAECNRDLKNYFNVNSRNDVPKIRFDESVEYAKDWKPCTNTAMLIQNCNAQMNIGG